MDWLIGKGRRKEKDISNTDDGASKSYLDPVLVQQNLMPDTDFNDLTILPYEMDLHEWLASSAMSFFQNVNLLWGAIDDLCRNKSKSACSITQYTWIDERNKGRKCIAADYINSAINWMNSTITDDSIFPSKHGQPFPSNFDVLLSRIFRYLFHILAHIYHAHFQDLSNSSLLLHAHLNCLFRHFITFLQQFPFLVESKEMECMEDLITVIVDSQKTKSISFSNSSSSKTDTHNQQSVNVSSHSRYHNNATNDSGSATNNSMRSYHGDHNSNDSTLASNMVNLSLSNHGSELSQTSMNQKFSPSTSPTMQQYRDNIVGQQVIDRGDKSSNTPLVHKSRVMDATITTDGSLRVQQPGDINTSFCSNIPVVNSSNKFPQSLDKSLVSHQNVHNNYSNGSNANNNSSHFNVINTRAKIDNQQHIITGNALR